VLMGCSGGGAVCIDFTLQHPSLVKGLVLVGSGLDGLQPSGGMSPTLTAYVQALQAHDLERSLELSLQIFTDGSRRKPEQVNPVARERTRVMSAPLFARPEVPEAVPQGLTPPAIKRLGEIRGPTLVIVGSEDNPVIQTIAALLLNNIPKARSVVIPDAGHHPNLEHPELFNAIVAKFLSDIDHRS
jgi:pimeloyl-ACP methyl ester carboxylesterase